MEIYLKLLTADDDKKLFVFECENREFFEKMVPGRGDDYYRYDIFLQRHHELLKEQEEGISFFFLIKNKQGEILGRMNLVDIKEGQGFIGYRVGEAHTGKGVAERALKMLLKDADNYVTEIRAKTTADNLPSQKVLTRNDFKLVETEEDAPVLGNSFLHYRWRAAGKEGCI